jgi:serine O-acetyltransferase
VVVKEVPPNSLVVGVPGRVIYRDGKRVPQTIDLEMTDMPDPAEKAIRCVLERLQELEKEVEALKKELPSSHTPYAPASRYYSPRND